MKKNQLIIQLFCLLAVSAIRSQTTVIDTFYYTGTTQTFVTPQCASNLTIMLHGAQGGFDTLNGGGPGGQGGRIYVVMTATPGTFLYVNVGGPGHRNSGGWNGGGQGGAGIWSSGGGGGGSSDIRIGGNALSDRIFVAGGGGGAGGFKPQGFCTPTNSSYGGSGGGMSCITTSNSTSPSCPPTFGCGGENGNAPALTANCSGGASSGDGAGGGGGGITSGGGSSTSTNGCQGTAGTLFQGGVGGDSLCTNTYSLRGFYGGGGGGGGYYGGGGGHSSGYGNSLSCPISGGGGGGSTYLNNSFVLTYSLWGGNIGGAGIHNPITNVNSGAVTFSYTINGTNVSASASQNTICSGAQVVLTASGANSYTWLPVGNFNGATSASISVSPTSNTQYTLQGLNVFNCLSQTVVNVLVVPTSTVSINPAFPAICPGDSVSLSASGANFYNWSSGQTTSTITVSPAASTVYSLSGSLSGTNMACSNNASIQVVVYSVPTLTVSSTQTLICLNETATVSAGGAITYTWVSNGGTSTVNLGSMLVSPSANITYSVIGKAGNGCFTKGSVSIQVDACTGVRDFADPFLSLFPNPTLGKFYIQTITNAQITIYSSIGNLISSKEISAGEKNEFIIHSSGLYIVHYQSGDRKINFKLLVID